MPLQLLADPTKHLQFQPLEYLHGVFPDIGNDPAIFFQHLEADSRDPLRLSKDWKTCRASSHFPFIRLPDIACQSDRCRVDFRADFLKGIHSWLANMFTTFKT
jgi:hypothetical protein